MNIARMTFEVAKTAVSPCAARTASLTLANGTTVKTPAFLTTSSRGCVPNLTPDNVNVDKHVPGAVAVALEDFVERPQAPLLLKNLGSEPSRTRFSLPEEASIVLQTRKPSNVLPAKPNGKNTLAMYSSVGVVDIDIDLFPQMANAVSPEVFVAPADVSGLSASGACPGSNKVKKMVMRSQRWLEKCAEGVQVPLYASVLPTLPVLHQRDYLKTIVENQAKISGLVFHTRAEHSEYPETIDLSRFDSTRKPTSEQAAESAARKAKAQGPTDGLGNPLDVKTEHLTGPQLVLDELKALGLAQTLPLYHSGQCDTPQQMLLLIQQGFDLLSGYSVETFSDAGIALDFTFPATPGGKFGHNLWDPKFKNDFSPLADSNQALSAPHHRAYLYHLMDAHEMLGHVILEQHNLEIYNRFLAGVRRSIETGTFDKDVKEFFEVYGDSNTVLKLVKLTDELQGAHGADNDRF
ncbi:Queuine tRNA-ribosyltransferase [Yarrowia sp. B02]|nr:Queuine tRNA-ribosyltransferase [Yarrowia sp. B02]